MEENDSILKFSNKKTKKDDFVARNLLRAYRIEDSPEEIIAFLHKTLTSDVGQNSIEQVSRPLLAAYLVKEHLLPYLSYGFSNRVESREGAEVTIHDCNTSSQQHHLTFKH